jgi:hypothetical protein
VNTKTKKSRPSVGGTFFYDKDGTFVGTSRRRSACPDAEIRHPAAERFRAGK